MDFTFIYDRTQSDVDRVKELTNKIKDGTITQAELVEWNGNLKGAINSSDLSRLIDCIDYLSENIHIPITSQTVPEISRVSWYDTFGDNISALREGYTIHYDTPEVPNHPFNTYQKWNDIEKILFDLYEIYSNQTFYYSGTELYGNNILI